LYESFHYLGKMLETVTSLMERFLEFFDVDPSSKVILPTEKVDDKQDDTEDEAQAGNY